MERIFTGNQGDRYRMTLSFLRSGRRLAEGPTAIDAATQRRHFGFRLRLVDKLQPIGGGSGRGHPLSGTSETWMAPQGLRTTFSCVFEGFSRELSSNYIINTNYNALYSPIIYRKVATM